MNEIINNYTDNIFESIKHIDEYGIEFWYARDLQKVLEYKDWRNFQKVINKAVISAKNSISDKKDWIVEVNKPIKTGKGKQNRKNAVYKHFPDVRKTLKISKFNVNKQIVGFNKMIKCN